MSNSFLNNLYSFHMQWMHSSKYYKTSFTVCEKVQHLEFLFIILWVWLPFQVPDHNPNIKAAKNKSSTLKALKKKE